MFVCLLGALLAVALSWGGSLQGEGILEAGSDSEIFLVVGQGLSAWRTGFRGAGSSRERLEEIVRESAVVDLDGLE